MSTSMQPSVVETPVDERLEVIRNRMYEEKELDEQKPGNKDLVELLDAYLDPRKDLDHIDFLRGLLRIYKRSETDDAYQNFLKNKLTDDERNRIESFTDGGKAADVGQDFEIPHSIGVREEVETFQQAPRAVISAATPTFQMQANSSNSEADTAINGDVVPQHGFKGFVHKLADFLFAHRHEDEVKIWDNIRFQNWGRTVETTPRYTVWPQTTAGIVNIVKFAIKENMSIRCSGYRHSWSPIFGRNGQILISTLDPDKVAKLPDTTSLPLREGDPTELERIEIVPHLPPKTSGNTLVRVGTAVTNERLRRWCIKRGHVTLPLNVIMVEITLGGSNAPICHGAGLRHQTLSDLVRAVEYVDCHGHLRTVTDSQQLRAASGCFGLMGVVTHLTIEFEPMTYAELKPQKLPVMQAIPPPPGYEKPIPPALVIQLTPEQRKQDQAEFEKRCENDYYAEWFWFPYSDQVWVNTWNNTTNPEGVVDFPNDISIFIQWAGTVLMNIAQYSKVLDTIGKTIGIDFTSTTLISRSAMFLLGDKPVKTYLCDALHFQRAIQNVRVRDMEVEMPIPGRPSEHSVSTTQLVPDWTVAQRAWWDAILVAYEHERDQPQRMPLEMRIMGGSDVIMSPQRGNDFGTCSIEVLTLEAEREKWPAYSQQVLDRWMSYTDPEGKPLRNRPHWAKEWKDHMVGGVKWEEKLKGDYRQEIVEFKETLAAIGKEHGWTLEEIKERFSNDFFDGFIYGDGILTDVQGGKSGAFES